MIYKLNKNKLIYEDITYKIIIVFIVLLTLLILSSFSSTDKILTKLIPIESRPFIINKDNDFTPEKLREYLVEINIKFPYIVYSQARLETGNFKSKIFKENNNLFGMKIASKKRPSTNKGLQNNHAYYDSWKESVIDYALYQARYLSDLNTEENYLNYINEYYSESPNYVQELNKIIEKEKINFSKIVNQ